MYLQRLIKQACEKYNNMVLVSHGSIYCVSIISSVDDNKLTIANVLTTILTDVSTQAITLAEATEAIQVLLTKSEIRRIGLEQVIYWPCLQIDK